MRFIPREDRIMMSVDGYGYGVRNSRLSSWVVVVMLLTTLAVCGLSAPLKAVEDSETNSDGDEFLRYVVEILEADEAVGGTLKQEFVDMIGSSPSNDMLDYKKLMETMDKLLKSRDEGIDVNIRTKAEEEERLIRDNVRREHHRIIDSEYGVNARPEVDEKELRANREKLEHLDERRRADFKNRQMERERRRREKVLEDEKRGIFMDNIDEKKDTKHEPLHHPGSEAQYKEAYANKGFNESEFDPKVFFALYDRDDDQFLDSDELTSIFIHEAEKVFPGESTESIDLLHEEIARMREHVMDEVDTDKDHRVSLLEFLEATARSEFDVDPGWDDIEDMDEFDEEEFERYRMHREEEMLAREAHSKEDINLESMDLEERAVAEEEMRFLKHGNIDEQPDFKPVTQE